MSKQQATPPPIVLCLSGHDPVGGAGIQADIEAIVANAAHAATVITALTVQDTHTVERVEATPTATLLEAALAVMNDISIAAIKIGLLGSVENALAVGSLLRERPDIPVVLDPVLASGAGNDLANQALIDVIRNELLPRTTIVTPNTLELARLSGETDTAKAVATLQSTGCPYLLVTGTHADTVKVCNQLYMGDSVHRFEVDRLPGSFHGSGCTLAASLAAQLALGREIVDATRAAIDYTYASLQHAFTPGTGQAIPVRVRNET